MNAGDGMLFSERFWRNTGHLQVSKEERALQEAQVIAVGAECRRQGGSHSHVSRGCKRRADVDLGAGHRSTAQHTAQVCDALLVQGPELRDGCLHRGRRIVR